MTLKVIILIIRTNHTIATTMGLIVVNHKAHITVKNLTIRMVPITVKSLTIRMAPITAIARIIQMAPTTILMVRTEVIRMVLTVMAPTAMVLTAMAPATIRMVRIAVTQMAQTIAILMVVPKVDIQTAATRMIRTVGATRQTVAAAEAQDLAATRKQCSQ